jgi:hypothetical protein
MPRSERRKPKKEKKKKKKSIPGKEIPPHL